MNYLQQVKTEFQKLIKLKFVLILSVIVMIIAFSGPILSKVLDNYADRHYAERYGIDTEADYEVNGVTIKKGNPFYHSIYYYYEEILTFGLESFSDDEKKLINELLQSYTDYFMKYAEIITDEDDYRVSLIYKNEGAVVEQFLLERSATENKMALTNAVNFVAYIERMDEYFELTDEERELQLQKIENSEEIIYNAVQQDDFETYIDSLIVLEEKDIESYKREIDIQEKAAAENPDLEESANNEIMRLLTEIETKENNIIPNLLYRKENMIYPNADVWQNSALESIEINRYTIEELNLITSEEEFFNHDYLHYEYPTYEEFLKASKVTAADANKKIMIAQNSLESGKPDMSFERNGARNSVNNNLMFATIVSFLGILIGGYIIANEFQTGTVRLLMVRPKSRFKIFTSKYLAGLILLYIVYFIGMILNIVINGVLHGFSDYLNPNYTANGEINFWVLIMSRILICSVNIIFAYSVAFGMSTLARNAAIAIALPSALILGGIIAAGIMSVMKIAFILPYTPLPYLNFSNLYREYGLADSLMRSGVQLNIALGIVILLIIAFVFIGIGLINFQKRDITN